MKYKVKFEEDSLDDFNKGLAYYKLISTNLVERYNTEFWICVEKLKENSNAFQIRYANIRIIQIDKFPFTIHFFIEDYTIYVQRVLHDRRDY